MRLENKVALISGGARGMGASEAILFASEGAKVVIGDVLEDEGRQTEAQINESGGECLFLRLDVASESNWHDAVATIIDDQTDIQASLMALHKKYGWQMWVLDMGAKLTGKYHKRAYLRTEIKACGGY